jgi:hypothetical protein
MTAQKSQRRNTLTDMRDIISQHSLKNSLFVMAYSARLRSRMKRSQSSAVSKGFSSGIFSPLSRLCQSGWMSACIVGAIALVGGYHQAANAQGFTVITTCGTPNQTLRLGTVTTGFQDTTGTLCTVAGGGGGGTVTLGAGSATVGALTANQSVNEAQINGATVLTGAGVVTGSQRVGVAQDTTTIAGAAPGTAGSPSTNVITVQGIASGTPQPVVLTPASGGMSVKTFVSANSNNLTTIKAGAGQVYGAHCESIANAAAAYLKFFNGSPTMGSTAAVDQISIPAASSASGTGHELQTVNGVAYASGIYVALTGGIALADNTSVAASGFNCTIYYQ